MNKRPKILYVHNAYEIPLDRVKCYASLKKYAADIDILFTFSADYHRTFFDKIMYAAKLPTDPCHINHRLIKKVAEFKPDLVFVVKGVTIRPSTLCNIKAAGAKLVSWSNDDMYGWHNRSWYYTKGLAFYDLVVTQKSYNCRTNELPSLGAKHILFQNKAFDPVMHYPVENCYDCRYAFDVVFVGTYEKERLEKLLFLAENGIKVHIFGWAKSMPETFHSNLLFHNKHLYGKDYACVHSCSKISLNFLRKLSRDLQTSRSVEIPACKGFMLAERTNEHLQLFKEGSEAEFFASNAEMLKKIRYYLAHDKERKTIAEAGYRRCMNDDYSFDNRMKEIINKLFD